MSRFRQAGVTVGAGVTFECDQSEGAILFLPDGASRKELQNKEKFRGCALKNGAEWYNHAVQKFGRIVANGSMILVTGCDKAASWGIASYRSETKNEVARFSLKATEATKENASFAYRWETTRPASIRAGPSIFGDKSENQCIFLRGYTISVGGVAEAPLGAVVVRFQSFARDLFVLTFH